MNSVNNFQLENWLNSLLQTDKFKDYAPNGLQVQGISRINKVIAGVTASKDLIQTAINQKADAILVHHGWFWKNEPPTIKSIKYERIKLLLNNNINLYAYHLPLDAHPTLGNNAQLAKVLGFKPNLDTNGLPITFGDSGLMWSGTITPMPLEQLCQNINMKLGRKPLAVGNMQRIVNNVAWCTGGAQSMMQQAIDYGVDAYITGEASEPNYHLANESNVAFIAAGHHATERYGVQALSAEIAKQFNVTVNFVDLDNPI